MPTPRLKVHYREAGSNSQFYVCPGLPDTGTSRSIVHMDILNQAGIHFNALGVESVTTANGSDLACVGNVVLEIKVENKSVIIDALVSTNLHQRCLISWDDLRRLGIIPTGFPQIQASCQAIGTRSSPDTLESLLEEFADVFDEERVTPMAGEPMVIHVNRDAPGYKPLRLSTARQIPIHFQVEAEKNIKWFLDSGVIERVPNNEAVEWCSPGFFVQKPNGKARLVVDYSRINQYIQRPVHPFPSPRDVVRGIRPKSRFFMKLDAVQGYYQVPLHPDSTNYTTFLLPQGRFRFLRAPMGLCPSSDAFCYRTDDILSEVPDLLKIVDDCLLQAETETELLRRFRIALTCARTGKLTLSKPKVSMGSEIEYAGYIFSSLGIRPDPKRLAAIKDFPAPTDFTALRGFLGLVNQLGAFTPDLAHMTEEIRRLLKKGVAWRWLAEHQAAFEKVKSVLVSGLIVRAFDQNLATKLLTDASRLKGLGYALVQYGLNGKIRLIQCGSRGLSSAETRYATIEIECLAIVYAITDCRYYLFGAKFQVITDHRPLLGVFDKSLADLENERLLRMRLKLTNYTFTLYWTPGKTHFIADALSRAPVFDPPEIDVPASGKAASFNTNVIPADPALTKMYSAAQADDYYQFLLHAFMSGHKPSSLPAAIETSKLLSDLQSLGRVWDRLSIDTGGVLLVVDSYRIVVPHSERPYILNRIHESHSGITRTQALARQHFYWPGMTTDIKLKIQGCMKCQKVLASLPAEPLQQYYHAYEPMQCVSSDLFESIGKHYVLLCDRYSGMTWVAALNSLITSAIIKPIEAWFVQFGYPVRCLTDGGPQYRGEFNRWCEMNHIIHDVSSPHFHESNGLAEACVRSTKALLGKSSTFKEFERRHMEWKNVPSKGYETSPSERFFGRRQRIGLPIISPQPGPAVRVEGRKEFKPGDRVHLQNAISELWDETGVVLSQRDSGRSYMIRRDNGATNLLRNSRYLRPVVDQTGSIWRSHYDDHALRPAPQRALTYTPTLEKQDLPTPLRKGTRERTQTRLFNT